MFIQVRTGTSRIKGREGGDEREENIFNGNFCLRHLDNGGPVFLKIINY